MQKNERINFGNIQDLINIKDRNLFKIYLCELFKDLSLREQSGKEKGISLYIFLEIFRLPIIIGEKLFHCLCKDSNSFLSLKEFQEGLLDLFMGDYEITLRIIFKKR